MSERTSGPNVQCPKIEDCLYGIIAYRWLNAHLEHYLSFQIDSSFERCFHIQMLNISVALLVSLPVCETGAILCF
jgi:hypothetical protein